MKSKNSKSVKAITDKSPDREELIKTSSVNNSTGDTSTPTTQKEKKKKEEEEKTQEALK